MKFTPLFSIALLVLLSIGISNAQAAQSSETGKSDASQDKAPAAVTKSEIVLEKVEGNFPDFPRGMTSFGAAVIDGHIYVVGGKSGRAHAYAKSYQNRDVLCLDVNGKDQQWQTVGDNLGLQGLAIVAHKDRVYRIGGLEARNKEGDDHDLHSIAAVLQFNPADQSWAEMPSLPEARSSFDATVYGDNVYVVGGWKLDGENESQWADSVLVFDLSKPDGQWEKIPAPLQTRALAVRAHDDKLVVIGGIQQDGGPTSAVHMLDLKTNQWAEGPEVPTTSGIKAFGCSAVSINDSLLVSTYDGDIFRLSDDATKWELAHKLDTGRFFHQMLPVGNSRFAIVGGSHMEHGSQNQVEVFEVPAK